MRPIAETAEALSLLAARGETGFMEYLDAMTEGVEDIAPDCVGYSVSVMEQRLTLTVVASEQLFAELDAVQYIDGGPCVEALETDQTVDVPAIDVMSEHGWQMFAMANAAAGIASTLSIPIRDGERVICCINLYGSKPHAFDGARDELATLFGGSTTGVVTNADLSFSTRLEAAEAPTRLRERDEVHRAVEILIAEQRVDARTAETRLRQAAARANLTEAQVARAVLAMREQSPRV